MADMVEPESTGEVPEWPLVTAAEILANTSYRKDVTHQRAQTYILMDIAESLRVIADHFRQER